jgi:serine protein kinase
MFAVLTRMRRPRPEKYHGKLATIVSKLTAFEKLELFAHGVTPERLDDESSKLLRAALPELYRETESYAIYEGSVGASPREMRLVLLDASQNPRYEGLSPFAVLEELDSLCRERVNDYVWLQEEKLDGGYHDHEAFRKYLKAKLLDMLEDEIRSVSGLVDDASYRELFNRYVNHVSHWVKKETVRNLHTGASEEPDQRLMGEVEGLLRISDEPEKFRHSLISSIAAWAIDHPDTPVDESTVFSNSIKRLRDAVYADRRPTLARLCHNILILVREEGVGLDAAHREEAEHVLERLVADFGYSEASAADAAGALARERYAEYLL